MSPRDSSCRRPAVRSVADGGGQPLPAGRAEMRERGWDELDILIVSGDAYVDHPAFGPALIGRVLEADGWRVGVIAQPAWNEGPEPLLAMGAPRLFCGVSAGNLDSMVANYTAARRKRKEDAYTPGGGTGRRPNYATVVYTQLARQAFPGVPVILGGVEASLRRVAHYDYWQDRIRPSILADSKADLLVFGMAEAAIREIAHRLAVGEAPHAIPGTARLLGARESRELEAEHCTVLPSYEDCRRDVRCIRDLTRSVEREQNPYCGRRLVQFHGDRALVVEPPAEPLDTEAMDRLYQLPFSRLPHPNYAEPIPAFEMIEHSVTVVRGCGGGCSFCGLGLHQGRLLTSRSEESVICEVRKVAENPRFRGTISDLGGPTANLYGCRNGGDIRACRECRRASCLFPAICPHLKLNETDGVRLLRRVRSLDAVKHAFVASGIRMDVALRTPAYLRELVRHHVSGHLKVAPEHLHPGVLRRMRKPDADVFERFRRAFEGESRAAGREQYLVPYFIANFPGCTEAEMRVVETYLREGRWRLQQVQDFIPLPMTPAAAMYCTGLDYETGEAIRVNRGLAARRPQMRQLRGPRRGRRTR